MVATVLAELTSKSRRLEKVLYVVPLRALVTEKYAEWQTIFADSIVIPISSDYPRSDHISRTGRWDIAIIVFEKLYQWLAESSLARTLMSQLSLVILDELQCVGETGRGEKLEMVVALLRHYQQNNRKENGLLPFRLVGMGVSREIATGLQRWLDASILPQEAVSRPIPLLEAKLSRRQGDMTLYDEASGAIVDAAAAPPLIRTLLEGAPRYVELVRRAVNSGLRVLLYTAARQDAVKTAQHLASILPQRGIHESIHSELSEIDDSPVRRDLVKMLASRVGVHHGHMSPVERAIVENGFRSIDTDAPVSVLVATRTLGMGVNLPADIVVLRDVRTGQRVTQGTEPYRKLTVAEYRNFAGRAGRLRPGLPEDAVGLVVIYDARGRWRGVADELLNGIAEPLLSTMAQPTLGWAAHILPCISFHETFLRHGTPLERISDILTCSYLTTTGRYTDDGHKQISGELDALSDLNLVSKEGLTGAGHAIARFGLSLGGIQRLVAVASDFDRWWPARKLALLDEFFKTPDLSDHLYPPAAGSGVSYRERRIRAKEIRTYFTRYIDRSELIPGSSVESWIRTGDAPDTVDVNRLAKAIALNRWTEGSPFGPFVDFESGRLRMKLKSQTRLRIVAAFGYITLGQLSDAAEMATALVGALRCLIDQLNTDREPTALAAIVQDLWIWEQTLRYGVRPAMLCLPISVSLGTNERLRRNTILQLFDAMHQSSDPRPWLGESAPTGIPSRVWDAVQTGLRWWQSFAGDWSIGTDDSTTLRDILEQLSSLQRTSDARTAAADDVTQPTTSLEVTPPGGKARIVIHGQSHNDTSGGLPAHIRQTLEILEREARQQIAACAGRRDHVLALLQRELTRAPLRAKVRAILSQRDPFRPIWLVGIGTHIVPMGVWIGDIAALHLAEMRGRREGSEPLLVVTGDIADDIIAAPRGIRRLVAAPSLFALTQWVGQRPRDLAMLTAVITGQGSVLRNPIEAFENTLEALDEPGSHQYRRRPEA